MSATKKYILHVGYEVNDPLFEEKLRPYLGERIRDLNLDVYFAIIYHKLFAN